MDALVLQASETCFVQPSAYEVFNSVSRMQPRARASVRPSERTIERRTITRAIKQSSDRPIYESIDQNMKRLEIMCWSYVGLQQFSRLAMSLFGRRIFKTFVFQTLCINKTMSRTLYAYHGHIECAMAMVNTLLR